MSQHVRPAPLALTTGLIAALAVGCGHSKRFEDAYEQSKTSGPSMGTGGTGTGATGGTGGSTSGTGGGGTGGAPPMNACSDAPTQQFDSISMEAYVPSAKLLSDVDDLLGQMDLTAQISQMLGVDGTAQDYQDIERSPDVTLSSTTIRGYNYRDAGHGVNLDAGQYKGSGVRASDGNDFATVFPAESLRAASWDVELETRVGTAMGDETAASLNNMQLAPCMNIIRHPFWGRTQETYGEDGYHVGRMATALAVGLQKHVVACAKHFAANNIEKLRSKQDARMDDEQTLREIYGRHFEMVVRDGGIGCIMASYNMIDGVKSTQNAKLLTQILRGAPDKGGMGYRGLVISDWWAMPGDQVVPDASDARAKAIEAANAGLDIEVPWTLHYSTPTLTSAVNDGALDGKVIQDHARHVIEQKLRFNTAHQGDPWGMGTIESRLAPGTASIEANTKHEDIAEEAATKSAVLLNNGGMTPVLPIKNATNVAVVGLDSLITLNSTTYPKSGTTFHFSTDPALGDRGSSRVNGDPARCIGPTAGITAAAAGTGVTVTPYGGPDAATAAGAVAAANPDLVVVVVGYTPGDEGEEYAIPAGGDRQSLNLPAGHNELVSAVLDLGKPTVIVIESGSIVALPWLSHTNKNQATVWAGYGGVRGGAALGKLLFAKDGANFSGKMPLAWPQDDAQLQPFKDTVSEGITNMGYFFGYRYYDQQKAAGTPKVLTFAFGHGLSYSTFTYGNLVVPSCTDTPATKNAIVNVTVDITNSAGPAGDEVALLFIKPPMPPANITGHRPVKELKSFARVSLNPGEKKTVVLPLRVQDLRRWEGDATTGKWVIDPGNYGIMVGPSGDENDLTQMGTLTVQGG